MKKYTIGFNTKPDKEPETDIPMEICKGVTNPKKSVVQVYFPHRGTGWAYYNDQFDLKVGDYVYVEGKLEGYRGQVTEVNYSFKIKLSDYKKVIAVIDTNVVGDVYLAGSHVVSFDKNALPFSKVRTWYNAPGNEEDYEIGNDDSFSFPLDDLTKMNVSHAVASCGGNYYAENRVVFIEVNGAIGRAIVEGSENYEIEFNYSEGEISNLKCSCFCGYTCKHEFAAMLQLQESLKLISENYENQYSDYFAIISKHEFMNMVMSKKSSGKITLGA